jgi:hypothetical protein
MLLARRIAPTLVIGIALRILAVTSTAFTSTELFSRQCSSCHTIGKGDLVGPDLNGVTGRRDRAWLARFIRSSRAPCGACHRIRHPLAGWTTAMATFASELSLVYKHFGVGF